MRLTDKFTLKPKPDRKAKLLLITRDDLALLGKGETVEFDLQDNGGLVLIKVEDETE